MKGLCALLPILISSVLGAAPPEAQIPSPLNLTLSSIGNSKIKVTITNTNLEEGYNLVKINTILDDLDVNKVLITNEETRVQFTGYHFMYFYDQLDGESFFPLGPGQTREVMFDVAEIYWVHNTTTTLQKIVANGAFRYTTLNSTELTHMKTLAFTSNTLSVNIDQAEAKLVFERSTSQILTRRSDVTPTCQGDDLRKINQALKDCRFYAEAAQLDATFKQSNQYKKYFYDQDRHIVVKRLQAISKECGDPTSSKTIHYCKNPFSSGCRPGVGAFAMERRGIIVYCPPFFQAPAVRYACNGYTSGCQAGVVIHEMTHFAAVYAPPCDDMAYGTAKSELLGVLDAPFNADSYALYAMDLVVGC